MLLTRQPPRGGSAQTYRRAVPLIGVKNGANNVFTTPDNYLTTGNLPPIVDRNGQQLLDPLDWVASESGGPGTGFDTVTLVNTYPISVERLTIDYVVA